MSRLGLYHHAARAIPPGETRSFGELAAMAGSPAAARAAGRALRSRGPRSDVPWHRVVAANGALERDPARAALQLTRLRREGARPRAGESVARWARRRRLTHVADLRSGRLFAADDVRLERLDPARLEGFPSEERARARRFTPEGRAAPRMVGPPERARGRVPAAQPRLVARRLEGLDWNALGETLLAHGFAHVPRVLGAGSCAALLAAGSREERFDRSVHMEAKGYGIGSYRFWKEPLPEPARTLRRVLYERLRSVAVRLEPAVAPLPTTLARYQALCRARGQMRPSSILISYVAGGVNHPHQDAYGPVCFPVQALVVLSRRGVDFEGGDFVLWTERGPGDLEAHEVPADRGDLVLFAARQLGPGGPRTMHGMRNLEHGRRDALGLVFHLAR